MYVSLTEAMIIVAVLSMAIIIWIGGYVIIKSYDITDLALSHVMSIHNTLEAVAYKPNNSRIIHIGLPVNTRIIFEDTRMLIKVFKESPVDLENLYILLKSNLRENDYKNIVKNVTISKNERTIYIEYRISFANNLQLRYSDRVIKISFISSGEFNVSAMGVGP